MDPHARAAARQARLSPETTIGDPEPTGLPLEETVRYPLPGTAVPGAVAFSPDDRYLTYLHSPDRTLDRRLFALDPDGGDPFVAVVPPAGGAREGELSLEEQLERERRRELGLGVTTYSWAREGDRLLVPLRGGLWVQDGVRGELRQLVAADADGPALDPRISPDGATVSFVRGGELHVVDAGGDGAAPRRLTSSAEDGLTHGLAEFVAQEELDRHHGHWWSRDGRHLAFTRVDERHVPVYRIVHQGADEVGEGAQEDHRYPFAGKANALVTLAVIDAGGGEPRWLDVGDLGGDAGGYLARVHWGRDGRLHVQTVDRRQQRLTLLRFDPATGAREELLVEESDVWINVHDCFRSLDGGWFVWASERTGFRHVELRDPDGGLARTLTSGEWIVDTVVGVDEEAGTLWCTGTRDGPTQRHLYAVPLAGGDPRRITGDGGLHDVVLDHRHRRFVDTHSRADRPPTVTLRALDDGRVLRTVHDDPDPRVARLGLRPPRLTSFTTTDGATLHAALYHPPESAGPPPHPLVVSVYGGPHAQRVVDGWSVTTEMRAQWLREQGYLVAVVDNRGSARRGLAFEGAIRHDLGNLEVRDQAEAVAWLARSGLADPTRVGVYGWSYGGYMALMCLARAPGVFHVGVAGAPVTHWDGYDTCYTERYMGLPAENPGGYERSSVMAHAGAIEGDLLLVHGLIDENVHFRHTARLLNALHRHGVDYELLVFPGDRHVPRDEGDRLYMQRRVVEFLARGLRK